jgi:hypothetical protein
VKIDLYKLDALAGALQEGYVCLTTEEMLDVVELARQALTPELISHEATMAAIAMVGRAPANPASWLHGYFNSFTKRGEHPELDRPDLRERFLQLAMSTASKAPTLAQVSEPIVFEFDDGPGDRQQ